MVDQVSFTLELIISFYFDFTYHIPCIKISVKTKIANNNGKYPSVLQCVKYIICIYS